MGRRRELHPSELNLRAPRSPESRSPAAAPAASAFPRLTPPAPPSPGPSEPHRTAAACSGVACCTLRCCSAQLSFSPQSTTWPAGVCLTAQSGASSRARPGPRARRAQDPQTRRTERGRPPPPAPLADISSSGPQDSARRKLGGLVLLESLGRRGRCCCGASHPRGGCPGADGRDDIMRAVGALLVAVAANVLVSGMTGASPVADPFPQDVAAPSPLGLLSSFANPTLAMQAPGEEESPGRPIGPDVEFHVHTRSNPVNPQVVAINSTSTPVDPSIDLVVILHGFTGSVSSTSVTLIRDALLFKQNITVVAVQWANLARGPWYDLAAANTLLVAQHLYRLLLNLEESGLDLMRVHIIGFSLGAHAAGITGSLLNGRLGRITGLDPARPGFEKVNNTGRLDASDANFVVGLHTGAGFVAMSEAVGHVDFYPNGGSKQPHCQTEDIPLVCNHFMAYTYFAESIYNPEAFPAHNCTSWTDFDNGLCDTNDVIPMGYSTPNSSKGLYFLRTNAQEPYGLGQANRRVDLDISQSDIPSTTGTDDIVEPMNPELAPAGGGHNRDIYSVDNSNKPGLEEQNSNDLISSPKSFSSSCQLHYESTLILLALFVGFHFSSYFYYS